MKLSSKRRSELISGPYTRLLAENERMIAELYQCFAIAIPAAAEFWGKMAKEEFQHQKIIGTISEKFQSSKWSFARPTFTTTQIMLSTENISGMIETVAKKGICMKDALQYAIELERTLLDSDFFQIIDRDDASMMDILQSLGSYTSSHIKELERESKRLKWKFLRGKKLPQKSSGLSSKNLQDSVKTAQAPLIGNMAALEESIAALYRTYADRLEESSSFWAKLAAEEMQHSAVIKKLYDVLERGKVFYNVSRFNEELMIKDIDKVLDLEFEARNGDLSQYSAVNTALQVERSLAEHSFYATVESDAPEFKYIAARMIDESKAHIRRLEEEVGRTIDMGLLAARPAKPLKSKE